jgi:hypothetical protein
MNAQKTNTNEERVSAFAKCFWWFTSLLVLHIGTFWVPFLWATTSRHPNNDLVTWTMSGGLILTFVLSIVSIYKFARLLGKKYVWILWILAANFPLTAAIAYLLLANRAHSELVRLGSRMALQLSLAGVGCLSGSVLLAGCFVFFHEIQNVRNHEQLKKFGQPITGTLQMVTRHYLDGIMPIGYSFDIGYAGTSHRFDADDEQYQANTLPGGQFTRHDMALTYLPDHPDVVELAGTSPSPLTGFGNAVGIILIGGSGLCAVIKKFPRNPHRKKSPPIADPPPTNRAFTVSRRG